MTGHISHAANDNFDPGPYSQRGLNTYARLMTEFPSAQKMAPGPIMAMIELEVFRSDAVSRISTCE